jgi:hypothetical protein
MGTWKMNLTQKKTWLKFLVAIIEFKERIAEFVNLSKQILDK